MKTIFHNITIDNFASIGHIYLEYAESGLFSIVGENRDTDTADNNGSGKSSMMEALLWGLYEKTLKEVRRKADLQNKNSDGDLRVEVNFTQDDTDYKIVRTLASTDLYIGGSKETYSSSKPKTDKKISELFPSIDLFCNIVYLGGSGEFNFSQYNSRSRTELLEEIMDISIYNESREQVKKAIKAIKIALTEKDSDLARLGGKLEVIESEIDSLTGTMKDSGIEDKTRKEQTSKLEEKLTTLEDVDIEKAEEDRRGLEGSIGTLDEDAMELKSTLMSVERDIQKNRGKLQKYKSLGDICYACDQKVPESKKRELVIKLEREIEEDIEKVQKIESDLSDIKSTINTYKESLSVCKIKIDTFNKKKNLKKELSQLKEIENVNIKSLEERLNKNTEKLREITESIKTVEKEKSILLESKEYKNLLEKIFSPAGLRSYKLDDALSYMNNKLVSYCSDIFGEEIRVYLSPVKEVGKDTKNSIELEIEYGGGKYETLSKSERLRVDFLLHLAQRDLSQEYSGTTYNILKLDEVFTGLDDTAVRQASLLLQNLAEKTAVYVTSHKEGLKTMGERLTIVRKNKISTLI